MSHAERPIPGTVPTEGTEFVYIEASRADLEVVLDGIIDAVTEMGCTPKGGIGTQNVELVLHGSLRMQALSYRGDIDIWRDAVHSFSVKSGRHIGSIRNNALVLDDSRVVPLGACMVSYYQRLG